MPSLISTGELQAPVTQFKVKRAAAGVCVGPYRAYDEHDLRRLRCITGLRRLRLDLADAGRLAGLCASGQCEEMSRDLLSLVATQRASIEQWRAELDVLDRQLAAVETVLADASQATERCVKGGDENDPARLLPVSVSVPVAVLTR